MQKAQTLIRFIENGEGQAMLFDGELTIEGHRIKGTWNGIKTSILLSDITSITATIQEVEA